jgi:hypothetical protein
MKSKIFLLLILFLSLYSCVEEEDETIEIETERIVNGRILFSANNQIPQNLKVLTLDGIRELDNNSILNLPSSSGV